MFFVSEFINAGGEPGNAAAVLDSSINLTCNSNSNATVDVSTPTINRFVRGSELNPFLPGKERWEIDSSITGRLMLTLNQIKMSDAGLYSCAVTGGNRRTFRLIVVGKVVLFSLDVNEDVQQVHILCCQLGQNKISIECYILYFVGSKISNSLTTVFLFLFQSIIRSDIIV